MRVVLDTNVVVSGLLFGAVPGRILTAWTAGEFTLIVSPPVPARVSVDPDDETFLAAAVAGAAGYVVCGGKHLLAVGGWHGIRVLKPRALLGPARIAAPLTPVAADRRGRRRSTPFARRRGNTGGVYRPHLSLPPDGDFLGVAFVDGRRELSLGTMPSRPLPSSTRSMASTKVCS